VAFQWPARLEPTSAASTLQRTANADRTPAQVVERIADAPADEDHCVSENLQDESQELAEKLQQSDNDAEQCAEHAEQEKDRDDGYGANSITPVAPSCGDQDRHETAPACGPEKKPRLTCLAGRGGAQEEQAGEETGPSAS
jgi:hypothetical protein